MGGRINSLQGLLLARTLAVNDKKDCNLLLTDHSDTLVSERLSLSRGTGTRREEVCSAPGSETKTQDFASQCLGEWHTEVISFVCVFSWTPRDYSPLSSMQLHGFWLDSHLQAEQDGAGSRAHFGFSLNQGRSGHGRGQLLWVDVPLDEMRQQSLLQIQPNNHCLMWHFHVDTVVSSQVIWISLLSCCFTASDDLPDNICHVLYLDIFVSFFFLLRIYLNVSLFNSRRI